MLKVLRNPNFTSTMSPNHFYVFAMFSVSVGASQLDNSIRPTSLDGPIAGVPNEKDYYKNDLPRSWEQARRYCLMNDARMASFETEDQYTQLNTWSPTNVPQTYWTAGRDAGEHRQFSWDINLKEVENFGEEFDPIQPKLTCMYIFVSGGGANMVFRTYDCNATTTGTLCEKPSAKP